jgi:DNA-binding winged helix-turn-helix (wHTH) protein/Tfp pilus assembly protein PilF
MLPQPAAAPRERFTFGPFVLDAAERQLSRDGREVSLSPKAFDLLAALVRRAGHLINKRELLDLVWRDAFVEEGILAVHVSALRKALGDDRQSAAYIQTIARTGYRFIATVLATDGTADLRPGAGSGTVLPHLTPSSPEVYELVGRGRAHLLTASRPLVAHAIDAFEQAIALDPTYAAGHAGLALARCAQAESRLVAPAEGYAQARASALRALAMDPTNADAQVALAAVLLFSEWDWIGAERSLQRALELNPNHTQARVLYGRLLDALGRLDEGLEMKLRALERDPLSPSVHLAIALSYWNQRRYDDALRWAAKTLELDPAHLLAREFLAGAYWKLGDFDRHMAESIRHAESFGVAADALEPVKRAYATGGRPAVIQLALDHAAAQPAAFPPFQLALLHAELGRLDRALPCLERAVEDRDPCLVDLGVAPQWDALRGDPRFTGCLTRMGLVNAPQR